MTRLTTPKEEYVFDYPQAEDFTQKQLSVFWFPHEIEVSKDVQDIRVNMTEQEQHGVITVLKLFTLYELGVGVEYWGNKIMKLFPRPEIQKMANMFSFVELNIHAPFYSTINEELGLATEEFYSSYAEDPTLKSRMDFIGDTLDGEDDLFSLAIFSLIEGVILYSNFAFLKSFQSDGKNKLLNIVRGINFSVRDEALHSEAGAWLYRQWKDELEVDEAREADLLKRITEACEVVYEHECRIIDMIFEKGPIDGITDVQLKRFVQSRINTVLQSLGYNNLYEVKYNPIADWFYRGINSFQFNDFFSGIGNSYSRKWSGSKFNWK